MQDDCEVKKKRKKIKLGKKREIDGNYSFKRALKQKGWRTQFLKIQIHVLRMTFYSYNPVSKGK